MRAAWVLNLDADLELGSGRGYAATNAVRASMQPHVERLAASLLGPDDLLVDDTSAPGVAAGLVGRAFCPTPRAVALLERAGAGLEPHPSPEVLRLVNRRAFCASLGETLAEASFVTDLDAAVEQLARAPAIARQWRLKRAFGMAGRGQRVIAPGAISEPDRAFLRASIAEGGGVQIEPDVAIARELGVHGVLDASGALRLGRLVEQRCDAFGQWLETVAAHEVDGAIAQAIVDEARRVGSALHAAGYFGPFGIDAFVYRDLQGTSHLQPRSEINARYSMGFAVGMAPA